MKDLTKNDYCSSSCTFSATCGLLWVQARSTERQVFFAMLRQFSIYTVKASPSFRPIKIQNITGTKWMTGGYPQLILG